MRELLNKLYAVQIELTDRLSNASVHSMGQREAKDTQRAIAHIVTAQLILLSVLIGWRKETQKARDE